MSNNKCLGFIETFGLAACVAAADAAVKSANVKLLGYEYAKGGGMCTVKVEGNVGACRAAIAAGKKAAEAVNGSLSGTKSTLLKARPADGMRELLVDNRETVGGEIALAEGYRPKGDTKKPVLVKNWKPKTEPKAEVVTEEAPEPPVVEEPEEEEPTSEEPETEEVKEEAPVEEPKAEEPAEETPVEETPVEEAPVEEPTPTATRSTATARASIWTATARFPTYASSASCAIVCRIWEKRCSFSLPTAATTAAAASDRKSVV